MKDIPLFTAQNGIASLILKEIAFSRRAYVLIKTVWNDRVEDLLQECLGFCRAVGAEEVYASWDLAELPLPHACDMIWMEAEKATLPSPGHPVETEALTPKNGKIFLEIYNTSFRPLIGAASYGEKDLQRLYNTDCAFLAKQDGQYAGICEISERALEAVAVLPPYRGLGCDLLLTVLPMVPRKRIALKVADSNEKALRLYRRIGFEKTVPASRWWRLG